MTNAQTIGEALTNFNSLEDFSQEIVVDYISCPSEPHCEYDGGKNNDCCTECKIKWLNKEFEQEAEE